MSKKLEFMVTGVHVPKVCFSARVLVSPDGLQQVKASALDMGQIYLRPGEVLEIDAQDVDGVRQAVRVSDPHAKSTRDACLFGWSEFAGDVTIYADETDLLARIAYLVPAALRGQGPQHKGAEGESGGVFLDAKHLNSIQVGGVQVFFNRAREKEEDEPEGEPKGKKRTFDYEADADLKAPPGISIRDLERLGSRVRS
ncbi:hypothetical protein IPV08_19140, partial [Methylobacterium sp. SD274]|jgi:hypothetical protein|uniref:Uncharacterized protein n=1 Tax=Methylobacterium gossipiicola TaxID=582675 RepID=A0A1I2V5M9_9HYPH|nr:MULTISPECIES: hypothetical protein [Methylobacterium]MBO1022076.1 hypothetical protein [Methylobacterium sp. SD274]SFG82401.1 hypothetical protein SAMN05192565_112104 [Methylobacterium gossipiicola]